MSSPDKKPAQTVKELDMLNRSNRRIKEHLEQHEDKEVEKTAMVIESEEDKSLSYMTPGVEVSYRDKLLNLHIEHT